VCDVFYFSVCVSVFGVFVRVTESGCECVSYLSVVYPCNFIVSLYGFCVCECDFVVLVRF